MGAIGMGFRSELAVRRVDGNSEWELTAPLIYAGDWEYFVIRPGFRTDFASIPRIVRWLLDVGGRNAAPGVLHDACWKESQRPVEQRRVDPWHCDALFRRALRETGASPVTRNMIWVAVRLVALFSGRPGSLGPSLPVKLARIGLWVLIALVIIVVPTAAILFGYLAFVIAGIPAAIATIVYARWRNRSTNSYDPGRIFPKLTKTRSTSRSAVDSTEFLLVVSKAECDDEQLLLSDPEISRASSDPGVTSKHQPA